MALIDRIKYDGAADGNWLVYKYPSEDLTMGAQLVVGEGQLAIFVKEGRALDLFGPGTHTLSTGNIPLLNQLVNLPFGNETPFTAEIYYINTTLNMNLKWGTESPIQIVDPVYHVRINARANGQYTMRVNDYSIFLTQIIGTQKGGTTITVQNLLPNFKGIVLNSVDTILAQYIIEKKVSVLDIRTKQREIAQLCMDDMKDGFLTFGIELVNFFVNSINFPDEDMEVINGILQRKAEFDILGDARYATQKQFEIMGNFSKNEGTSGMANAGIGMGLGFGMMGQLGGAISNISNNTIRQPVPSPAETSVPCKHCNSANSADAKFCADCGQKMQSTKPCYKCNAENKENAKFCSECGTAIGIISCPSCSHELTAGSRFCPECGTSLV
ncbi:SPFH domain-containing protein [Paenibacillus alba]|uniref:SPFH domain-containing protein n=1 Tax=Paenibacillus alba TaxID=1197127 RepID=A0ABU6FYF3_9BACL|nr:SPFH domain-containing protein [Paenibacillus alba]MEC0226741.1 SPFH domain-containing protein [Paenibacillus alba]NQX68524.1 SPFH domain-containing protein [Paenibacillus alba]